MRSQLRFLPYFFFFFIFLFFSNFFLSATKHENVLSLGSILKFYYDFISCLVTTLEVITSRSALYEPFNYQLIDFRRALNFKIVSSPDVKNTA